MLAGYISQESSGEECAKKNRGARVRRDGNERAKDQHHKNDIRDMIELRKGMLDIPSEEPREDVFCEYWREDGHGDGGDDGPADDPAQVDIASAGEFTQIGYYAVDD